MLSFTIPYDQHTINFLDLILGVDDNKHVKTLTYRKENAGNTMHNHVIPNILSKIFQLVK